MLELPIITPGTQAHTCAVRCGGACCKYYATALDTPRSREQFDELRWYLMRPDTHVYKVDGDWFLLVNQDCRHLGPNNLCTIYETRPQICKDHSADDCEFTGEIEYQAYFRDDAELDRWLAERKAKRSAAAKKAASKRKKAKRKPN
ncbi:MAG: YkgJ family cysteine cluster protein [Acidobacteriota bacterium]